MNYNESKVYLENLSKYGSVLGLENMIEMLDRLGNPQDDLKFIHIAGTNGKGSVLAFLSTILQKAGYRTGRYISPALFCYEERIQVDGCYIEKDAIARHLSKIADIIESMVLDHLPHPTVFEVETVLSFLYFKEQGCDFVVLETGLGGLDDATNVITTSILEVLTPISMDHVGVLGNTLPEIAQKKAGIIKPDTRVVCAPQKPEALMVIEQVCQEKHARLSLVDDAAIHAQNLQLNQQTFSYKNWKDVTISLNGVYQIANACLCLEAIEALKDYGLAIEEKPVRDGLLRTQWKGRFTVLQNSPTLIIDGAHNPDAAWQLRRSLETYFSDYLPERKFIFITGIFKDKDYEEVVRITAPLAKKVYAIETAGNERALPKEKLMQIWKKQWKQLQNQPAENIQVGRDAQSLEIICADSVALAVQMALDSADENDIIVAFGSLSFLKDVVSY